MPYTVTITRTDTVKTSRQEWVTLSEKNGEKTNGYGPELIRDGTKDTKVLEQTVEFLDLIAVIKAVNGIAASTPTK